MIAALANFAAAAIGADTRMDQEQFRCFHEQTARPLWAYLARVSRDHSLADDLVQDAFLRFLRAEQDGHVLPEKRKQYLFQIAANLLRDHFRRHKTEELGETPAAAPAAQIDLRRDVSRILERLAPTERNLLWLAYVERFSHKEIAAMTGVTQQSVRPLVFRAKQKLAGLLRKAGLGAADVS